MIIEGAISVKAALQGNRRKVNEVYISAFKKTKDFNYIRKLAESKGVTLREMDKEQLGEKLCGRSHGGVGALVEERNFDELADGDIFFLDGIEDPFNLAYALRTLYAFGFQNVLLNQRDYRAMEAQLLKSSAGAFDLLNIKLVEEELSQIRSFKDKGYHIYALYRGNDARDIFAETFKEKALIILGGEKRGISSALLKEADSHLYISYGSDFRNALNASAALDVSATLLYAQRRKG